MNFVVVTNKPLTSLAHGYDVRVWHLCDALRRSGHLLHQVVIPTAWDANHPPDSSVSPEQLFDSIAVVDPRLASLPPQSRVLRHLRSNERDYLRLAKPELFKASVQAVCDARVKRNADRTIVFGSELGGVARVLQGVPVLFDVCDSAALAERREQRVAPSRGVTDRIQRALYLWRLCRSEASLGEFAKTITTISPADTAEIERLTRGSVPVVTVPNGVATALEQWRPRAVMHPSSVVFWGNLEFSPNASALRYFYESVYTPYLAAQGIRFCVVGRNAPPWLKAEATRNPALTLTGFVKDLYETVGGYPVMVNPMVSGSGMKNKVLEAFALGLAVVSTPMGMESMEGARPGVHHMEATAPAEFAHHVVKLLADESLRTRVTTAARALVTDRYTWATVAEQWVRLAEGV